MRQRNKIKPLTVKSFVISGNLNKGVAGEGLWEASNDPNFAEGRLSLAAPHLFPCGSPPPKPHWAPSPEKKLGRQRGTPPPNSVIPLGTLDQRKDGRRYWGKVQGIHEPIHKVSGYFKKLSSPIASIVFSEKGSHRTENPVRS